MASLIGRVRRKLARQIRVPRALSMVPVEIGGKVFQSPVVDNGYCDTSEPWMLDLLGGLLNARKGMFVDVGMNLGQTLLVVKAIDPVRDYLGFEPNPQCFSYCERLVRCNELTRVSLVPIGLAASSGIARLQLYSSDATDQAASIVQGFRPEQRIVSEKLVPIFSFADVSRSLGLGPVGIVKIDVEGGEWDVLKSMEQMLAESRPWIVIEILPCYHDDNTARIARQQSIEALLKRLDYRLLRIAKGAAMRLSGLEPIETIGVHGDISKSDYVLCPRNDAEAVIAAAGRYAIAG